MEENKTERNETRTSGLGERSPETASETGRTEASTGNAETPGWLRKRFPTVGDLFALLGIMLAAQVVMGVIIAIVSLFMGTGFDFASTHPVIQGRIMAAAYFCSMALSLVGILFYRKMRGGSGPVGNFSPKGLDPVLLLWAFAFMLAVGVVAEPLMTRLPPPAVDQVGRGFWTFVTLAVFAPVFEEVICRGIVLGSMRAKWGVVTAWLGSALFFGVIHLHPTLVINAFIIGLILGFIYIATGSLWSVIILHALNNALAYLLMSFGNQDTMLVDLIGSRTLYVLVYIAALAVAVVSGYMTWRTLSELKKQEKNNAEA